MSRCEKFDTATGVFAANVKSKIAVQRNHFDVFDVFDKEIIRGARARGVSPRSCKSQEILCDSTPSKNPRQIRQISQHPTVVCRFPFDKHGGIDVKYHVKYGLREKV